MKTKLILNCKKQRILNYKKLILPLNYKKLLLNYKTTYFRLQKQLILTYSLPDITSSCSK